MGKLLGLSLILDMPKKLECLLLECFFRLSFEQLEVLLNLVKDKHSSLFHLTISKKNKKVSKIDTWNRIDQLDRCFRDLGPML